MQKKPTIAEFEALVRSTAKELGMNVESVTFTDEDLGTGLKVVDVYVTHAPDIHKHAVALQETIHRAILQNVRVGYYQPSESGGPALFEIDLVVLAA